MSLCKESSHCIYICIHKYIYIYIHTHIYIYIYVYTYSCDIGPKISGSPGIQLSDAKALVLKVRATAKKSTTTQDNNTKKFSQKMQMSDQTPPTQPFTTHHQVQIKRSRSA